jgi:hypothetical protein
MSLHVPNQYRLRAHPRLASSDEDGNNGAFALPPLFADRQLAVVASDGLGWEHVSVHVNRKDGPRTPTWDEMCHVKAIFWDEDDVVVQFHPRRADYVNFHAHTLHLWRPVGVEFPTPHPVMVGPRSEVKP